MTTLKEIWNEFQRWVGSMTIMVAAFLSLLYYTGHLTIAPVSSQAFITTIR